MEEPNKLPKEASEEKKPKTVTVNEEALNKVLAELEETKGKVAMLTEVADLARLENWRTRNKKAAPTVVKLNTYKGKVITAWETIENKVYQDANMNWHEKQIIRIYLDDKSSEDLAYLDFVRSTDKIDGEIRSRTRDEESGSEVLKVVSENGKEYVIDSRFVN